MRLDEPPTLEEAVELVQALATGGMSLSDAAKEAARQTGYKKGELYKHSLNVPVPEQEG